MSFHPGSVFGLPAGLIQPSDVPVLRWVLLSLCLLWAAASLRRSPWPAAAVGFLYGTAAVGFWILALGRPYGLLVDPEATRAAADAAVAAAAGDATRGAIVGSPPARGLLAGLAALGLDAPLLLLVPTWLPLLAFLGMAFVLALLLPRPRGLLAASLWLAFPSSAVALTWGEGFLSSPWRRAEGLLGVAPVLALLLVASRARGATRVTLLAGTVAAVAWSFWLQPAHPHDAHLGLTLLALTLDQGPFLLLGGWGLVRSRDAASTMLLVAGAAASLASALGLGSDPWCGLTLYRVGLIAAACGPIEVLERWLGARLQGNAPLSRLDTAPLGRALLLALAVPSSALFWWNPIGLDGRVAERSVEPLPSALLETAHWIRRQTDVERVFVASPVYAPAVAALAGRQVLRAPTLAQPPDGVRRRVQAAILEGRSDPAMTRLRVGYLFVGPGDASRWPLGDAASLERRGLRRAFQSAEGDFSVYSVSHGME